MSGRPTQFASKTGVETTGLFRCFKATNEPEEVGNPSPSFPAVASPSMASSHTGMISNSLELEYIYRTLARRIPTAAHELCS